MSAIHEIVILANSVKQGGSCVAGKDMRTKEWIRPVSSKEGGSLSSAYISNTYGTYKAKPLQKALVPFSEKVPLHRQPENMLIANNQPWKQHYNMDRSQLDNFVDTPEDIWDHGRKQDRVASSYFEQNTLAGHHSLYLIKVKKLVLEVEMNSNGYHKLVGTFTYNQKEYTFSVTDPAYCQYKKNEIGYTYNEYDKYLCLSLTDDFNGFSYKLIASIL